MSDADKALQDAMLYGTGYMRDGKHIPVEETLLPVPPIDYAGLVEKLVEAYSAANKPKLGKDVDAAGILNLIALRNLVPDAIRAIEDVLSDLDAWKARFIELTTARPGEEYHEDMGPMLWWRFPIVEPPYAGHPNDCDWPGYHTHFSPIPIPRLALSLPTNETDDE